MSRKATQSSTVKMLQEKQGVSAEEILAWVTVNSEGTPMAELVMTAKGIVEGPAVGPFFMCAAAARNVRANVATVIAPAALAKYPALVIGGRSDVSDSVNFGNASFLGRVFITAAASGGNAWAGSWVSKNGGVLSPIVTRDQSDRGKRAGDIAGERIQKLASSDRDSLQALLSDASFCKKCGGLVNQLEEKAASAQAKLGPPALPAKPVAAT